MSIEELISKLEHVEESELSSDIRANVRAELKRIRRNVSHILDFVAQLGQDDGEASLELQHLIGEVRRECLFINGMIFRILIFQALRMGQARCVEYRAKIISHYSEMAQVTGQLCRLESPLLTEQLMVAL